MAAVESLPAADPAPLGLAGFALTTFLLSGHNASFIPDLIWVGPAIFYGGLAQFMAGMWEFRNRNVFGATAFSTYGGFWMGLGLFVILAGTTKFTSGYAGGDLTNALAWYLFAFAVFNTYMLIHSTRVTMAVFLVFLTLEITEIVLVIGFFNLSHGGTAWWLHLGGWCGIVTAAVDWYTSSAGVVNGMAGRVVFPVGAALMPARSPVPASRRGDRLVSTETGQAIDTLFLEERRYPPPEEFAAQANAKPSIYDEDFESFWDREAKERLTWFEPFSTLYEWNRPFAKWFLGGKLNVSYNCVDRHVEAGKGDKVAFHWEGEPEGDTRTITYADLQKEVVAFANALQELGVQKGTAVGIYMGMVPELPIAMLACTRLGAPHTVVFGGFSADSLSGRVNDMGCEVIITQDEAWRRGSTVALKKIADEAMDDSPGVKKYLVVKRTGGDVNMQEGRDHWYHDVRGSDDPSSCPPEPMDSEDLLFLMYTSGTTAKPKGIKHTTGGYLLGAATSHYYVFDLKADTDVYWCAADVGWITGHSYIVYGPLCNGATSVMYEGTPDYPDKDRWWDIAERYGVTILYTAPTAIRTHMKWGPEYAQKHDLSKLRLLGSVGEPINPEAWIWYQENIGGGKAPIVDTWWQTETGMIMITPLPGVTTTKPGSATKPFPGVEVG